MRRLERVDALVLAGPPETWFPVLADFSRYPDWWPSQVRFRVEGPNPARVGTRLRIANGPLVRWTATVTSVEPSRSLGFRYGEGAWEGEAGWTLTPVPGGTEVAYRISIVPVPLWIRGLGRLVDLGYLHSRTMGTILTNLRDLSLR